MKTKKVNTKALVLTALFAALVAVCSQISIPLPMVPINLALFAVHMAGALLGFKYGSISLLVYLLLGAVGVPVFANFKGGLGTLMGPTGGYIIGYILCVIIVGLLADKWANKFWQLCIAMLAGVAVCYTFGTVWFMFVTKNDLLTSLTYCVFPFLIGDAVKIALAAFLSVKLKPHINI